jgi:hypothetical protein
MYKRLLQVLVVIAGAAGVVAFGACEVQKSAHPLSPSVAGPIPGVNITAPKAMDPPSGARMEVTKQPITLTVENATTNGVRPLSYLFEVATDTQFANKVFTKGDVSPGTPRTSITLPELAPERTYYWRALARDGANTGSYTSATTFSVYTPVVISAPTPIAPANGETVTTLTPTLIVRNAPRTGPAGPLVYQFIVGESEAALGANWFTPETASQTSFQVPEGVLLPGRQYFWLSRAYDVGVVIGPLTPPQTFRTPAPNLPPPGGGSSGSTDFAALGNVQIVGGSPDVRNWAITSRITSLRFAPGIVHLEHTKLGQWPGVDIGGALQESTLWVFFRIGGLWYATGGERWRVAQTDKELSAPSAIGPGWFYSSHWAPMTNYVPMPGELVGFMIVAGSTRADNRAPVQERSSILMIPFPPDGVSASFP